MRNLSDPEYIAKLLEASRVMNPRYIEVQEGACIQNDKGGYRYYGGFRLVIVGSTPLPPTMKVTVDPPKPVPAKKPKKRAAPRAKRLKNPAIRKDGVILLKDREPEPK